MLNPEGLTALSGHAFAVHRTARRLSENDWRVDGVWREDPIGVAALDAAARVSFLEWVGDGLIAVGAWLKTRAAQPGYQQA